MWITQLLEYNGGMPSYCQPFSGKKITLMGLGLLGRGVGDAEFLAGCGAEVLVTDKKSEDELTESVTQLKKHSNVEFHLGGHRIEDFTSADMIVKAAGVPLESPEIAAARNSGVEVVMSTALFANYASAAGAIIVGVTGTRGKSTIAHMIYHSLIRANRRTLLGGNVRGRSTLAMLPEIKSGDIVVLELDSWQLQGFGEMKISPHISIFSNLMPDHMNYYAGDMEKYFADKANIFLFQKKDDTLIVGKNIVERVHAAHPPREAIMPPKIPTEWTLQIIGEHNRENASFAAAALRALGLSESEIRSGMELFEPVEGRLQFLREIGGVKIYNDNNATTPEATIMALRALGSGTTLIVGGSEKNLPLEELVSEIKKNVSHVILLTHPNYKGSTRLAEILKSQNVPFEETHDLLGALKAALEHTKMGSILFSPGFASFGMFKNEYERNDQFVALVQDLSA